MFSDMFLSMALNMMTNDGWAVPTEEELSSFSPDELVNWLIEHNPDKKDIIQERYGNIKDLDALNSMFNDKD